MENQNNTYDFLNCFVFFCILFTIIFIVGFCSISKNTKKISNELEIIKMEIIKKENEDAM